MSKFVPQKSGGDEAQVQKVVIGDWEGSVVQTQGQEGRFQL